jgi:hypothetical protein
MERFKKEKELILAIKANKTLLKASGANEADQQGESFQAK